MVGTVTCLAIGDPHFMVSNITDAQILVKKVNSLVKKLQPTFVVILGDLLHRHEQVHVTPYKLATEFIKSLSRKTMVFVIIGNHDYINNKQFLTDNHAFNAFKRWTNVVVCDRPICRVIGGLKFVFCPYVYPDRFEEALDTLQDKGKCWDDAECIFAHQEFYGCSYNPVATSTVGDIWPEDYPLVVSGHIHNEQRLQTNIYYPGSSMQHAFGESANKIVAYLQFKQGEPFKLSRIDLEMRKKKIVYLDVQEADGFTTEENTHNKLVLRGSPEQFKVFRRGQTYKDLQSQGVKISFSPNTTHAAASKKTTKKTVLQILQELIQKDDEYVQQMFDKLCADE